MFKKAKTHQCKCCARNFMITPIDVTREWVAVGYDADYEAYFVKCPECRHKEEIKWYKLPLGIIWYLVKKHRN